MAVRSKLAEAFEAEVRRGEARGVSKIFAGLMDREMTHTKHYAESFAEPSSRVKPKPKIDGIVMDEASWITSDSNLSDKDEIHVDLYTRITADYFLPERTHSLADKRVCVYQMRVRGEYLLDGEVHVLRMGSFALGAVELRDHSQPEGYRLDTALSAFDDEDHDSNERKMKAFMVDIRNSLQRQDMEHLPPGDPRRGHPVVGMGSMNRFLRGAGDAVWVDINEDGFAELLRDLQIGQQGSIAEHLYRGMSKMRECAFTRARAHKAQRESEKKQVANTKARSEAYGEVWGSW